MARDDPEDAPNEANRRARRFYEKLGWAVTGERSRTTFPPHPELLEYTYRLAQ